jgi:hypothetical protein
MHAGGRAIGEQHVLNMRYKMEEIIVALKGRECMHAAIAQLGEHARRCMILGGACKAPALTLRRSVGRRLARRSSDYRIDGCSANPVEPHRPHAFT